MQSFKKVNIYTIYNLVGNREVDSSRISQVVQVHDQITLFYTDIIF